MDYLTHMKELLNGFYGVNIYLPLSGLSRKLRRVSRKLRGKGDTGLQQVALPTVSWKSISKERFPKVWEFDKSNGNIRISELAIINALAKECEENTNLLEIGTFDGRTSLNLSFSTHENCKVYTLDLKKDMDTKYEIDRGETHMVDKERSGVRIDKFRDANNPIADKITQLYGDSAQFDFSPYYDSCSLVFIDGSHAYDYAKSDTIQALKMVKKGGVIIWHDYGIWKGVTQALEEMESEEKRGFKSIAGTSLVYWKKD